MQDAPEKDALGDTPTDVTHRSDARIVAVQMTGPPNR